MSQPSFFIFGVPNGFDILDGDLAVTNYFQNYYNSSKENTKFSIHRNAGDGGVTYAYLKYNLSSGKGREGSFFGMALYFPENGCCTNILKLYRLFDTIYDKVILADGEILKSTDGTSYIQAKYAITRFCEKREYITQRIQSNILSNIDTFADSFVPIDGSFTSENSDLGKRISLQNTDNNTLLNLLRQYNRLSISPDWGSTPEPPTIPEEVLWQWNKNSTELSLFVNQCYRNLNSANVIEIKRKFVLINKINETFKKCSCSKDADQEIVNCYNETKKRYLTLKKDYASLLAQLDDKETPPPPPPTPPTINPIPWWKNPKLLAVGGVAVLVAIILVIFVGKPSKSFTSEEQPIRIVQHVRELIAHQAYMEAINMADGLDVTLRKHLQDSALTLRIDSFLKSTYDYSDAYENIANKINNDSLRSRKQEELISAWEVYVDKEITDVEKSKNKENAKQWKEKINDKRSIGHQSDKFNTFNQRLDAIINPSPRNPNPGITPSNTPSPTTETKYRIEIWRVTKESDIDFSWEREGKQIINSDTELSGRYFYYRLMQSSDGIKWSPCPSTVADKCINSDNAELKTTGAANGAYKICKQMGNLTIVDSNRILFTITIKQ